MYLFSLLLLSLLLPTSESSSSSRGIFLHLTDLHPDPHYLYNSLESDYCHSPSTTTTSSKPGYSEEEEEKQRVRGGSVVSSSLNNNNNNGQIQFRGGEGDRRAGYFGLPISECDTPISLLNSTLNFISKNFPSSSSSSSSSASTAFDLIILTGDSARHDLDALKFPRTLKEISKLNEMVSLKIRENFGNKVKVMVTIGNNDVFPHNVAFPGPNKVTTSLLDLWMEKNFIPEEMKRTFLRGGYYSLELIENELLIISLNTIYFFEKNSVVEGCPPVNDELKMKIKMEMGMLVEDIDPGSEQLLWFEQQLVMAKEKGMKIWIIGHVPPEENNWYKLCLEQYSKLVIQHGQNVLGQFFGHMNQDHFSFLTLPTSTSSSSTSSSALNSFISIQDSSELPSILYKHFKQTLSSLSSSNNSNKHNELLFSSFQVSPSLIPTYLPTFRIYEYQTNHPLSSSPPPLSTPSSSSSLSRFFSFFSSSSIIIKNKESTPLINTSPPPKFIPLSYTQFYIPLSSIEHSNKLYDQLYQNTTTEEERTENGQWWWENKLKEIEPRWEIEYTTLNKEEFIDRLLSSQEEDQNQNQNQDQDRERELVIKKEFMPKEIKQFLSLSINNDTTKKKRKQRKGLEKLLEKYDLVPFEIETKSQFGGLSNKNWLKLAKDLVGSRDQLRKKKKKHHHGGNTREKGKGKMWKKWVERMGVRTGEL
ncbi:hypothetical protein JCM3765_000039 [Sporobolomyces pararoseus]